MAIAIMELAIAKIVVAIVIHAVDFASHTFMYPPNLQTYTPMLLSV